MSHPRSRVPASRVRPSLAKVALLSLCLAVTAGCGVTERFLPTPIPTTDEDPALGWGWHVSAADHRGENGKVFEYVCPPGGGLSTIWGTDVYTDDSPICVAAVQVGLIQREAGGRVKIVIRPGQDQYRGSTRNGVTSDDYGAWEGSFAFVP